MEWEPTVTALIVPTASLHNKAHPQSTQLQVCSSPPEIIEAQAMCRGIDTSKQMTAVLGTHVVYPLIEVQDGPLRAAATKALTVKDILSTIMELSTRQLSARQVPVIGTELLKNVLLSGMCISGLQ